MEHDDRYEVSNDVSDAVARSVSAVMSEEVNVVSDGDRMVSEVPEVPSSVCNRVGKVCTQHQCNMTRFTTKKQRWVQNSRTGLYKYRPGVVVGWRCDSTKQHPPQLGA